MSTGQDPMSPEAVRVIVSTIEQGWHAALAAIREAEAVRTAELRGQYQRLATRFLVMSCVLIISVVAGLLAFRVQLNAQGKQADRLNGVVQVQERQRQVAIVDRCRQTNDLTTGLRTFVRKVAPNLLPLAERQFRVVPNCARYADRLLRSKHPPTPPRGGSGR